MFGVTDDTALRDHALAVLRKRLPAGITLRDFRYNAEHLSLLEGAVEATASSNGRPVVFVTGFETLRPDKQTEAIKLLNLQRNRLGYTNIAVILWVNQAMLAEISRQAADFYCWRSATFLIEPPPGWNTLESSRHDYLDALVRHNEFVNLQGLAPTRGGRIVQMRMEDIFIPLRVERQVTSLGLLPLLGSSMEAIGDLQQVDGLADQHADILGSAAFRLEDAGPEKMPLELRLEWERSMRKLKPDVELRRVETAELLRERRAIVVGDPGAGKTTLLRYIAHQLAQGQITDHQSEIVTRVPDLADCLPVYVRIGEYAQYLQQIPEATLEDFAPIGSQARQLPLTAELLKDAMAQGRILFLLDGLDEIADTRQRREVASRIEEFAGSHSQCRIIVTSRIVGYRQAKLSGEFSEFTISPFEDEEIRRFAQSWYKALGSPENAKKLVEAIETNASVRRLASNPLLITVIALIHWRGTKLPHHRVRLYHVAAETLVDQWMSRRQVSPEQWDARETLQVLLPAIAWHLHATTSSGLIREQELQQLLFETLQQHDSYSSEAEAHSHASQFRRNVSQFSGIFLERGLDQDGRGIYGFLHLAFEEYFAARRLADKWEREGDSALRSRLHNPRWTEIILLAAGHLGDASPIRATQFVQAIRNAESEYEEILHRDLLMAARCLADDVSVDTQPRRQIVSELVSIYDDPQSPGALHEDIVKAFAGLGGTAAESDLLKLLAKRLDDTDTTVRRAAALALGRMGTAGADPDILSRLLQLLDDKHAIVRFAAAEALGRMGTAGADPDILPRLLHLLDDKHTGVRWAVADSLKNLAAYVQPQDQPRVAELFLRLARSRDARDRETGYVGLRNLLGAGSE